MNKTTMYRLLDKYGFRKAAVVIADKLGVKNNSEFRSKLGRYFHNKISHNKFYGINRTPETPRVTNDPRYKCACGERMSFDSFIKNGVKFVCKECKSTFIQRTE